MAAILFGSISTLADTSELQRRAFNEAFAAYGLDWTWSRDEYIAMLDASGGSRRIAAYAAARGDDVDAAELHNTKSRIFQELLGVTTLSPRPGVLDTIRAAQGHAIKLGFVTTTAPENVAALLAALHPHITAETFDIIVDSNCVRHPKPDPAAYVLALNGLDEKEDSAVAVEDNAAGVKAATAAGIVCVAFPNENTAIHDFSFAAEMVRTLEPKRVLSHLNM